MVLAFVCGEVWGNSYAELIVQPNNKNYGTVTGGGTSNKGSNGSTVSFNVTASANNGYRFVRWEFTSG